MTDTMPDIQTTCSEFPYKIQRVGINNVILPIKVQMKNEQEQNTVADIDCYVDLAPSCKGTHMSRLIIALQKYADLKISSKTLSDLTEYIKGRTDARTCEVVYRFPYFLNKVAPVSKEPCVSRVDVEFKYINNTDRDEFYVCVESTNTSLCPCSKEISTYGAHNQRSKIKLTSMQIINDVFSNSDNNISKVWIEDLVEIAEKNSSCEIYPVLKRPDEKYVTERAYNNPKFVEDSVRGIFHELKEIRDITWFSIEVSNEESIHQHNAYAKITSDGKSSYGQHEDATATG